MCHNKSDNSKIPSLYLSFLYICKCVDRFNLSSMCDMKVLGYESCLCGYIMFHRNVVFPQNIKSKRHTLNLAALSCSAFQMELLQKLPTFISKLFYLDSL